MKVFVTGATGFIGGNLIMKLAGAGHTVHALYRSISKTSELRHENIRWFKGDLNDPVSLSGAMEGCDTACHLGAFAAMLVRNTDIIYEQNVQGTVRVLESARKLGLRRVVFTSTAGVMGPSSASELDESAPTPGKMYTHYIRSKALAEKKVLEYVEQGMEVCIVNPTRVYGPGRLSTANTARLVDLYLRGRWRILPGTGRFTGNYVFVDDVSEGIIAALEKGRSGERYLLGGENLSLDELLDTVNRLAGKKYSMVRLPVPLIMATAWLLWLVARISRWVPPFTPGEVRRITRDWRSTSAKAGKELSYHPRSFEEGMKNTIEWLDTRHTHSSPGEAPA